METVPQYYVNVNTCDAPFETFISPYFDMLLAMQRDRHLTMLNVHVHEG